MRIDTAVDCILNAEINDDNTRGCLTNAVDAPNALFDAHRIPWQIIIDDYTRKLKVNTLRPDFGTKQNSTVIGGELLKQPIPFFSVFDVARDSQRGNAVRR